MTLPDLVLLLLFNYAVQKYTEAPTSLQQAVRTGQLSSLGPQMAVMVLAPTPRRSGLPSRPAPLQEGHAHGGDQRLTALTLPTPQTRRPWVRSFAVRLAPKWRSRTERPPRPLRMSTPLLFLHKRYVMPMAFRP